jgi:hypothetical protein
VLFKEQHFEDLCAFDDQKGIAADYFADIDE